MAIPAKPPGNGDIIESVLIKGDLAKLTPDERSLYYKKVCESMGLNPLTKPFEYITLNGKLQLYALRACTDQLRKINGVSLEIVSRDVADDILTIHVRARLPDGRVDEDLGSVAFSSTLKGEARANAELKCVTKAKRRATLSICGLGWLDETEVADIPAKAKTAWQPPAPAPNPMQTIPCDPTTGEIIEPRSANDTERGAAAAAAPTSEAAAVFDLAEEAHEAALRGEKTFKSFWRRLDKAERDQLLPMQSEFRRLMDEAAKAEKADESTN